MEDRLTGEDLWNMGETRMNTILFCPVRERPEVLRLALEAHRKLEGISIRHYVDDNEPYSESADLIGAEHFAWSLDEAASHAFIEEPMVCSGGTAEFGKIDYSNHKWSPQSMSRMARIRQKAIEIARKQFDFLFILDADVIPQPKTMSHLISLDLPVVSMVYWTQWPTPLVCECGHHETAHLAFRYEPRPCAYRDVAPFCKCRTYKEGRTPWLPNCWDFHNYQFVSIENILRLRIPGTYEVGGLGGITLIRRDAIERGASYEMIPGIRDYPGEDRHFSIRCACAGIPLHVNTEYPAFHVYRPEEQLQEALGWWDAARGWLTHSAPLYFNQEWLTDKWEQQIRSMGK